MDPRDDLSAQAWATLREYEEPARYLAPFAGAAAAGAPSTGTRSAGVPSQAVGPADHPLRAAPSTTRRPRGSDPDADAVRAYLQHSCDLVLRGGAGAAVTYPPMACALAEHYLVRRVGGSGAAAATAAAVAAAELGRTRPIDPGNAGTSAGSHAATGEELAGGPGDDTERIVLPG